MSCDKDSQAEVTMEVKKKLNEEEEGGCKNRPEFTALLRQVGQRQNGTCLG